MSQPSILPSYLVRPSIVRSWHAAGMPFISDWADQLSAELGLPVTKAMLMRQMVGSLAPIRHTISSFRDLAEAVDLNDAHPIWQQLVAAQDGPVMYGIPNNDEPPSPRGEALVTETQDGLSLSSTSTRIVTLEQLLEFCKVDTRRWKVDHFSINKWETATKHDGDDGVDVTPMIQIKAKLVRRQDADYDEVVDSLLDRLREMPDFSDIPPMYPQGEFLFIPAIFDVHFNKRTVDGAYTPVKALADFMRITDALIARVKALGMPVSRIAFPVGNDLLHSDTLAGTTTKGTPLDLAADQRSAIDCLTTAVIYAVSRLAEMAPVDVIVVPGNHDRMASYFVGKIIEAYFASHANVTVDTRHQERKYYRFGKTLLGFEHGEEIKPAQLALLMATEVPTLWAETQYREVLRGHIHTRQSMYYPATEEQGVIVRVIPALCPPDEWHSLRGFVGAARAAEGLLYHYVHGHAGIFPVFADEV